MARPIVRRAAAGAALAAAGAGVLVGGQWARTGRLSPPQPGRHTRVTSRDGTELDVTFAGPSHPRAAVVLVHGWAMDASFWHACAADVASEHLTVTYDQRGHGRSGNPGPEGTTVESLGADLAAVLALLPDDLPVLLVGHSMGAMSIVQWAAEHDDDRVVGAVLFNTGVHGLVPASAATFGRAGTPLRPVLHTVLTSTTPLGGLPPATLRSVVAWVAHGPDADRAAVNHTMRLVQQSRPRVRAGFGRSMAEMDLRPAMAHLDVPVQVVTGSHDRMTPIPLAEAITSGLPDASLHVMQRAGHQGPIEQPDVAAALVREHLDTSLRVASHAA